MAIFLVHVLTSFFEKKTSNNKSIDGILQENLVIEAGGEEGGPWNKLFTWDSDDA